MNQLAPRSRRMILLGWLFTGLGIWSIVTIFLCQWILREKDLSALVNENPFYQQFRDFQSLPEFYPLFAVLATLVIIAGVGLLRNTRWARKCALVYIGSAAISGTILSFRYVQAHGDLWLIGPLWILGMLTLMCFVRYLKTSGMTVPSHVVAAWKAYERFHWKIVHVLMVLFGISAILAGSVFTLWSFSLLRDPNSSVMVNGEQSTSLFPKVLIAFLGLFSIIIGVVCLIAKPFRSDSSRHGKP